MTYFLMLLFVWITLFLLSIGEKRMFSPNFAGTMFALIWASLGTFFFHNIF